VTHTASLIRSLITLSNEQAGMALGEIAAPSGHYRFYLFIYLFYLFILFIYLLNAD